MDDSSANTIFIPTIKEENDIPVCDVELPEGDQDCSEGNSNLQTLPGPEASANDEELKKLRTKMVEEENRAFIVARELMYKNLHSDKEKPITSSEDDSQLYETLTNSQFEKMYSEANNEQNPEINKAEEQVLMYYVLPGTLKPFCCTLCEYRSIKKDKMKRHLLVHRDKTRLDGEKPIIREMPIRRSLDDNQHYETLSTSQFEKMYEEAKKAADEEAKKDEYVESKRVENAKSQNSEDTETKKTEEESLYYILPGTEKPFCCSLCDYKSLRKDKMKRHLLIHSDKKPLACPLCSYRCARNDKLKKHMQTHGDTEYEKRGQKRKLIDENDDTFENSFPSISDYYDNTYSEVITTPSLGNEYHLADNTLTPNSPLDASLNQSYEDLNVQRTLVPYIPSFLGKPKTPIKKWQYSCGICDRKYKLEDSLIRHMEVHTGANDSGMMQSVSRPSEMSNNMFFNTTNNMNIDKTNEFYKPSSHAFFSHGIKAEAEFENSINNMATSSNGELNDPSNFLECSSEMKEECNRGLEPERDIAVKEERLDDNDVSDEVLSHIAEPMVVLEEGNESDDDFFSQIAEPMVVLEEGQDSSDAMNSNFDQEASDSFNSEFYQSNIDIINNGMNQSGMFSGINKNPVRKWANVCPICDRKYKLRESLIGHMDIHKNDEKYHEYIELFNQAAISEVDVSKDDFMETDISEVENEAITNPKIFICNYCDYKCTQKSKFIIHERIHTKEKPFACTVCDFKCARKDKLKNHMLRHTDEKPFACSECDYRCKRSESLKQHMLTHVGLKKNIESLIRVETGNNSENQPSQSINMKNNSMSPPELKKIESPFSEKKKWSWACHVCERKFKFKDSLVRHMEVHNSNNFDDKSSYRCPVCNYGFPQRSALDIHMMTHTGEKPFACGVCQYSANQKGNLKRHMLQLHGRVLESEYDASNDDYGPVPNFNEENRDKTDIIEPNTCVGEENKAKIIRNNVIEDLSIIEDLMEKEENNLKVQRDIDQSELTVIDKVQSISQNIDKSMIDVSLDEENKDKIPEKIVKKDLTVIDNLIVKEEENHNVHTDINQVELKVIENVQTIPQKIDKCLIEESLEHS
ncbi:unnamed protein product [Meganyctiphanes norvegica]|uniref:C2H2-type domain-containing protein n=1 Tax=Meganyctiphanes norvegica TaxID=48144 RepID=A0AAV2RZL5_MEGNR